MKRFLSLLLVLCLFACVLPSGVLADGTNLKVSTTSPSAFRGSEITFEVSISENSGFNSITNMRIDYDPDILRFVSVEPGEILGKGQKAVNDTTGFICFAYSGEIDEDEDSVKPLTANGLLFKATFSVLRSAPLGAMSVGVAFDYFRVSVSKTGFADVNPTIIPCSIEIEASESGERIAGNRRTETAAYISAESFESADNVILADGNNFADALAGVSLAYAMDAPILLIRNSKFDDITLNEIARLKAKTVTILGGVKAINETVETTLQDMGCRIERIAGNRRFDTAVLIAQALAERKGTASELFFVVSDNFPDALAVSNVAALKGSPVLYISPSGVLDDVTAAYLKTCGASKITIIGGTNAIAEVAESNLAAAAGLDPAKDIVRLSGKNRYMTCIRINEVYASTLNGKDICVATGTNYPDALAGGVFAARLSSPMLLVNTSLQDFQKSYLASRKPDIVYVFGGYTVVSEEVARAVVAASR